RTLAGKQEDFFRHVRVSVWGLWEGPGCVGRGARGNVPLPPEDVDAPRHAAADRREGDEHAGLEAAFGLGLVQRERDGGGGGVAVFLDVHEDLVFAKAELLADGGQDADVGLV